MAVLPSVLSEPRLILHPTTLPKKPNRYKLFQEYGIPLVVLELEEQLARFKQEYEHHLVSKRIKKKKNISFKKNNEVAVKLANLELAFRLEKHNGIHWKIRISFTRN